MSGKGQLGKGHVLEETTGFEEVSSPCFEGYCFYGFLYSQPGAFREY